MDSTEVRDRLASKPTGHLATVTPEHHPHVVVVTYAVVDNTIVTAIDHKPKSTRKLKRLSNLENDPRASFLVDHYDDDWERLWWIRVDGPASIHHDGTTAEQAIDALQDRYVQYRHRPPEGPVIALSIEAINWWASTP